MSAATKAPAATGRTAAPPLEVPRTEPVRAPSGPRLRIDVAGPPIVVDDLHPEPAAVPMRDGLRCLTWTSPGSLSAESQRQLYDVVLRLCNETFPIDFGAYWNQRRRAGYFESLSCFSLFVCPDDRIVGFTSYQLRRFGRRHCLFIDSTSILPEYQANGLLATHCARAFLRFKLRRPLSPCYVATRTENPVVHHALGHGLGRNAIFPQPERPVPSDVAELGQSLADWLGQGDRFRADQLRVVDAYDEGLFEELPPSGDEKLDRFFRETLNPEDAFIVIAPVRFRRISYVAKAKLSKAKRALTGARRSRRSSGATLQPR